MSLPTSLLRGSLAPPSPALWRSLAVSLSEKVAFEPELRREILKRLVTEWLDQPDFENETASILKKLADPASDLGEGSSAVSDPAVRRGTLGDSDAILTTRPLVVGNVPEDGLRPITERSVARTDCGWIC